MNAKEYYQCGDLTQAVAAATEDVKHRPTDLAKRSFLAELLCLSGDLQRADQQLDALGHQDPQAAMTVALFRQLVRAEQARRDFYEQGRLPEFLEPPPAHLRLHLEASIRLREGCPAEACKLLEEAEAARPRVAGTCGAEAFDDFRDADDLTAPLLEVLTSTGKYYWVPTERVELLEFHPPQRPRDLLWRRVHMVVCAGPDGEVFLPAIYAGAPAESDDQLRLGRKTDWRGGAGAPVRGAGQRMFLVGEEARSILELERIEFRDPVPGDDHATA
jgi:type VI secretion system protein ImpE